TLSHYPYQPGRHLYAVLRDDGDHDPVLRPPARLALGDEDDDDDRHDDQGDRRGAVAQDEGQLLGQQIEELQRPTSSAAPSGPYFLRMRSSKVSIEPWWSKRSICRRKFEVRLRSST